MPVLSRLSHHSVDRDLPVQAPRIRSEVGVTISAGLTARYIPITVLPNTSRFVVAEKTRLTLDALTTYIAREQEPTPQGYTYTPHFHL